MEEEKLEKLLYENPWMISFDLQPVTKILGDNGIPGRQVRLGSIGGRIDLLFKDRSGRPVIIELKTEETIKREHLAQILEYGGGLRLLSDEEREPYTSEFGDLYTFPRLILIGKSIGDAVQAAANLAGVEIWLWGDKPKEINISEFNKSAKEYKRLVEGGEYPGLVGRHQIADKVWEVLNSSAEKILGEDYNKTYWLKGAWWDEHTAPFCEFTVSYKKEPLLGTFEFKPDDPQYRLNEKTWWISFNITIEQERRVEAEKICKKHVTSKVEWTEYEGYEYPVFALPKTLFKPDQAKKLEEEFEKYLKLAKELADKYWEK